MYQIQATYHVNGVTRQVPIFYLNPDVQGIVSEDHARSIAYGMIFDMLKANGPIPDDYLITVHVVKV